MTDEEAGHPVITLAHEALITHWPRLAEWVARHRAILRSRQRLEENTRQWTESGHARKLLLAEGRLAEAEEVERSGLFQITVDETALIDASRRQARKRMRFFQGAAVVFAVLALGATAGGIFAAQQKREADRQRNTAVQAQADERRQRELVQQREAEQRRLLHDASMADYAVAVQTIDKDDRWREGVAHLAHALDWEPDSAFAAERRYATIAVRAPRKAHILRAMLSDEEYLRSASFSPDGDRIVTVNDKETARVLDAATGKPLGETMRHEASVKGPAFSPDGTRKVTTSDGKTAQVWDAATGKPLGEPMDHEFDVQSANFSPDGTRIVTAIGSGDVSSVGASGERGRDGSARVWDAATGKPLGDPIRHKGAVESASFSPDGGKIVTASVDQVRVWDAATGEPLGESMRHANEVSGATFSPDSQKIVTVGDDNSARIWDAATGKAIGEPMRHEDRVWSAQFSPDGTRIVTASDDKTARAWDTSTGKEVGEPMRHEDRVRSAQFSPDGTRIVTASDDKTAQV